MQFNRPFRSRFLLLALAALGSSWVASHGRAAEPLRWKFTSGERLNYTISQNMNMKMNAGAQGPINTSMKHNMDMAWDVQQVNEEGEAQILLSFNRVKMKMSMNTPMGEQGFDYDSESEEEPTGMAAMVAPLFDAMTKGQMEVTMSPQGEVLDVKIPQEVIDALQKSPGAGMMGDMATPEGFKQMIMQASLVLPEEALTKGHEWSNKVEMNNPMVGKQTVETTYVYDGTKDVGGTTYDVFRPSIKMGFEGQGTMKISVKKQTSSGEILFNGEAGRLHSSKLVQDLTMDMMVSGQALSQEIHQAVDVMVNPVD